MKYMSAHSAMEAGSSSTFSGKGIWTSRRTGIDALARQHKYLSPKDMRTTTYGECHGQLKEQAQRREGCEAQRHDRHATRIHMYTHEFIMGHKRMLRNASISNNCCIVTTTMLACMHAHCSIPTDKHL